MIHIFFIAGITMQNNQNNIKENIYKHLLNTSLNKPVAVNLYKDNGKILVEVIDVVKKNNRIIETKTIYLWEEDKNNLFPISADLLTAGSENGNTVYVIDGVSSKLNGVYKFFEFFNIYKETKPIP
jgi:hypothetical protein